MKGVRNHPHLSATIRNNNFLNISVGVLKLAKQNELKIRYARYTVGSNPTTDTIFYKFFHVCSETSNKN